MRRLRIFWLIDSPASRLSPVSHMTSRVSHARRVRSERYPSEGFSPQQKMCVWASTLGALAVIIRHGRAAEGDITQALSHLSLPAGNRHFHRKLLPCWG